MDEHNRYLRIALVAVGIAFLLIYPLTKIWASGWVWQPDQSESLQMIIGIYDPAERGHLFGDVPALILVAIVLGFLASREVVPVHE
jgi:hypothetical protein